MQQPKHVLFGVLLAGGLRVPAKLGTHGRKLLRQFGPFVLKDRHFQPTLCFLGISGGVARAVTYSHSRPRGNKSRGGALGAWFQGFGTEGRRVTDALILINCAAWAAQVLTGGRITAWGLKSNAAIRQGQWWRVLTSGFLHSGVMHLAANCFSLNNVGPAVEESSGRLRYVVVYTLSVVGGTMGSFFLSPKNSLGASGGVFGLLGAYGIFMYRHKEQLGESRVAAILQNLGQVVLFNLAIGLSPGIDNWGHVGGLLAGAVASFLLGPQWHIRRGNGIILEDRPPLKLLAAPPRVLQ